MSTDVSGKTLEHTVEPGGLDLRSRRVLRLALGVTTMLAIAYAIDWPLAFTSAVFGWVILKDPEPGYGLRDTAFLIGAIFRGLLCGLLVGVLFANAPPLMLLVVTLVLFLTFYAATGGAHLYSLIFMLVGNTIIPLFAAKSIEVATHEFTSIQPFCNY